MPPKECEECKSLLTDIKIAQAKQSEGIDYIKSSVGEIKQHQEKQNGFIQQLFIASARNTTWRKVIVGVGGVSILTLAGWLFSIIK